jgi:hypothetical protein
VRGSYVDPFFLAGEKIDQKRSDLTGPQLLRDVAIARAEPAAPVPWAKKTIPGGSGGNDQVPFQNGRPFSGDAVDELGCDHGIY